MAIQVALNHCTRFEYDKPVTLGPQVARLRPAPHCRTPISTYSMTVRPAKHSVHWQQDPFGNFQARLLFPEKTREFVVDVDLIADLSPVNPFDYFLEPGSRGIPVRRPSLRWPEISSHISCLSPLVCCCGVLWLAFLLKSGQRPVS